MAKTKPLSRSVVRRLTAQGVEVIKGAFMQYVRRVGSDKLATWVRKDMKGKDSEYNACESCIAYKPYSDIDNCGYNKQIQDMYDAWGMVLIVWECPFMEFERTEGWSCLSCGALNSDDNVLCSYCGLDKEEI